MRFVPSRSRTRWLLVTGTAAACVAAVVTGTVAANAEEKAPAPRPSVTLKDGSSAAPAPAPDPDPALPQKFGEVISTGLPAKDGEWVFYGAKVEDMPGVDFGIMLGRKLADGGLEAAVMANETEGAATAPGFHAVSGSMAIGAGDSLTFGYYAGPATKITAKVGSRTVTASQAVWSEDPSVVVFWFAPKTSIEDLAAFDASGKKLPTGNSSVGVG